MIFTALFDWFRFSWSGRMLREETNQDLPPGRRNGMSENVFMIWTVSICASDSTQSIKHHRILWVILHSYFLLYTYNALILIFSFFIFRYFAVIWTIRPFPLGSSSTRTAVVLLGSWGEIEKIVCHVACFLETPLSPSLTLSIQMTAWDSESSLSRSVRVWINRLLCLSHTSFKMSCALIVGQWIRVRGGYDSTINFQGTGFV